MSNQIQEVEPIVSGRRVEHQGYEFYVSLWPDHSYAILNATTQRETQGMLSAHAPQWHVEARVKAAIQEALAAEREGSR